MCRGRGGQSIRFSAGVRFYDLPQGKTIPDLFVVGNGKLLDRQFFDTLLEAKVLIGRWRKDYNTVTYTFQGRQRCAGEETAAIEGGVLGRFAPARGANGATR
jgi:hypothetical protein